MLDYEQEPIEENPDCIPRFDCYMQKLVDLSKRWVGIPSIVTIGNLKPVVIAAYNPFRIYLRIDWTSGGILSVGINGQPLGSGAGKQMQAYTDYVESGIQQQGTMPSQSWIGLSATSTTVNVWEGIYYGNTNRPCPPWKKK